MRIFGYCITFVDDVDVLPNCLSSLARIPVDKIVVVDGGLDHAMMHHQRNFKPIQEWILSRDECETIGCNGMISEYRWGGVPLVILENTMVSPGGQRNYALNWIDSQSDRPDWVVALDADEVESSEAESGMRDYLESLSEDTTNVVQPLLNLLQDEEHYAMGPHSSWLSHSRLHRTGSVSYSNQWHEHQNYVGNRARWDARIIHTRMLFRRRLWIQRNAHTIRSAWKDVEIGPIPDGIDWYPFEWPAGERVILFDEDVRQYE